MRRDYDYAAEGKGSILQSSHDFHVIEILNEMVKKILL